MKTAEEVLDSYYNESGFELHKLQRIWALLAMEEYASLRTSKLEELIGLYEEYYKLLDEFNPFEGDDEIKGKQFRKQIAEFRKELKIE